MPRDRSPGPDLCETFVDPRREPYTYGRARRNLPHLYKEGCTFFVTFCLQDAAPAKFARRCELDGGDARPNQVARLSEPVSDRGSLVLKRPEVAGIVEKSLTHFQGDRYGLHAWVVMPNHVHAVLTPSKDHQLPDILHSWKSFTASRVNRLLGRSGRLWQRESFDHVVRSRESLLKLIHYTEENPVAAGLCRRAEDWPFSSARFRR